LLLNFDMPVMDIINVSVSKQVIIYAFCPIDFSCLQTSCLGLKR